MTAARIDEVIKQGIGPLLKEAGFVKKGRLWNRAIGDFVYVADVQESRYNDSGQARFTLNFGVCSLKAFSLCWGRPISKFVKETDCLLRKRIGELLVLSDSENAIDYWWKLEKPEDVQSVASEVAIVIRGRLLPYLQMITSIEALRDVIAQHIAKNNRDTLSGIYLAIVNALLGNLEMAQEQLASLRQSSPDSWKERIDDVAKRLQECARAS